MANSRISNKPDYILLGIAGLLVVLGILILASISAPYAQSKFNNTYYFLNHQILFGLIPGLILGFLAFRMNLSLIKKWTPFFLLGSLFFMVMVFVPGIGLKIEGAARWVSLGPISFQPSEFLKLAFILYLAAWLANRIPSQNKSNKYGLEKNFSQTFIFFLAILGLIGLTLFLQPDISTLGVIFFIAVFMYFSSNTPFIHSIIITALGVGGLLLMAKIAPYRTNRILVFLNPDIDPMGIGYQLKQSLIAVGSGGITGTGLGMGIQKLGFLPESVSDSVFAAFAEEVGFIGGIFLVALFLLFLWRGFKIIKETKDKFFQLAALGIVSWITLQAFINIGAMIGVFPLTGIPLPFISYGGSALISSLIGIGILLNISKNA